VNEYVPFGSEIVILLVVEAWVVPAKVMDHAVPAGSPVSWKLTR
jgi:hypothetical protein